MHYQILSTTKGWSRSLIYINGMVSSNSFVCELSLHHLTKIVKTLNNHPKLQQSRSKSMEFKNNNRHKIDRKTFKICLSLQF